MQTRATEDKNDFHDGLSFHLSLWKVKKNSNELKDDTAVIIVRRLKASLYSIVCRKVNEKKPLEQFTNTETTKKK